MPQSVHIEERTLTNNQAYDEMLKERFTWSTTEGPSPVVYPEDQTPNEVIALQPQRIRVFRVKFNSDTLTDFAYIDQAFARHMGFIQ